jgi:hypothetical protein
MNWIENRSGLLIGFSCCVQKKELINLGDDMLKEAGSVTGYSHREVVISP